MILVTGGTGLLGSHLLYELIKINGDSKIIATRRTGSNIEEVRRVFGYYSEDADNLFSKIDWKELDILDYAALLETMEDIDCVYHCAAIVSFERRHRKLMIRNNVEGTANIVDSCIEKGVKKLVHVSSSAAIGQPLDDLPAEESMIYAQSKNNTGYSISKFKSEMEIWRGIEQGLNAVIVNPTIILGAGFWNRGSSIIFSRGWKGIPFYTTGENGFVGVMDVVNVMILLMSSDISGERFIINSENLSYRKLLGIIANSFRNIEPRREVSNSLLIFLSKLDWVQSHFSNNRMITSEQARAGGTLARFSNSKIISNLGIEFMKIQQVVHEIAEIYIKDK